MLHIIRTTSNNLDFCHLVQMLDEDLRVRNGETDAFYAQHNKLDAIKHAVVSYLDGTPVGCGAIKEFTPELMEVKRMFVLLAHRGQGAAPAVLADLEQWTRELGYAGCVLETGLQNPEAIRLYEKSGYQRIPNYGQYVGVESSVCMQKDFS